MTRVKDRRIQRSTVGEDDLDDDNDDVDVDDDEDEDLDDLDLGRARSAGRPSARTGGGATITRCLSVHRLQRSPVKRSSARGACLRRRPCASTRDPTTTVRRRWRRSATMSRRRDVSQSRRLVVGRNGDATANLKHPSIRQGPSFRVKK